MTTIDDLAYIGRYKTEPVYMKKGDYDNWYNKEGRVYNPEPFFTYGFIKKFYSKMEGIKFGL